MQHLEKHYPAQLFSSCIDEYIGSYSLTEVDYMSGCHVTSGPRITQTHMEQASPAHAMEFPLAGNMWSISPGQLRPDTRQNYGQAPQFSFVAGKAHMTLDRSHR